jgi:hypothetical protein
MVGFLARKCRKMRPREGWERHPFLRNEKKDTADDPTPIFYRGRAQKPLFTSLLKTKVK